MSIRKPKINFYDWSVDGEIATVYAEKLDEGREFTIEKEDVIYELGVSMVIDDASQSVKEDIGEDFEIGIASVISKRKIDDFEYNVY